MLFPNFQFLIPCQVNAGMRLEKLSTRQCKCSPLSSCFGGQFLRKCRIPKIFVNPHNFMCEHPVDVQNTQVVGFINPINLPLRFI